MTKIYFSILGDMKVHNQLWICITEAKVMENIKPEELQRIFSPKYLDLFWKI